MISYCAVMKRRSFISLTVAGIGSLAGAMLWPVGVSRAGITNATVYKDPNCGCCNKWIEHLTRAGFVVEAYNRDDMSAVKAELGVPRRLESCHTALIDGYVVEGHVPVSDIERLLLERPGGLGLAVPGMPIGSPGMEYGNEREPYEVVLFRADGRQTTFAQY